MEHTLFVITSTGYAEETATDLSKYRIPTGTFYINRTANLLNMYLSAIYGQGRYAEACYHNQIYLNHKLIEQKKLSLNDVLSRSQEFLVLSAGVSDVYTTDRLLAGNNDILKIRNGFNPNLNGCLLYTSEYTRGLLSVRLYTWCYHVRLRCRQRFLPRYLRAIPIRLYHQIRRPQ